MEIFLKLSLSRLVAHVGGAALTLRDVAPGIQRPRCIEIILMGEDWPDESQVWVTR